MNLIATVIEVAPQDGYAIVRFQLTGTDGSATTGGLFLRGGWGLFGV